jgi:hypothetical protein
MPYLMPSLSATALLGGWIILVALVTHVRWQPYSEAGLNRMDSLSLICVYVRLTSSVMPPLFLTHCVSVLQGTQSVSLVFFVLTSKDGSKDKGALDVSLTLMAMLVNAGMLFYLVYVSLTSKLIMAENL